MFPASNPQAPTLSLACLGLDGRAESSLKSLIGILKGKTPNDWQVVENLDADVIIYDPASPLAQALLRREAKSASGHVFLPCSSDDPGEYGLGLPLRAERLMHCLRLAAAQVRPSATHAVERKSLCERLDAILQMKSVIAVEINAGPTSGILNPTRKTILWPHALNADALARLLTDEVSLRPLYAADLNALRVAEQGLTEQIGWDGPLWAIGVTTSHGQLLPRLQATTPYRLSRWPDFGLLGRRSSDIKCVALLTHKAMSVNELVAATGFSEARVNGFINACALCGLLEQSQAPVQTPASAPHHGDGFFNSGMLQRIRRAFSLGVHNA